MVNLNGNEKDQINVICLKRTLKSLIIELNVTDLQTYIIYSINSLLTKACITIDNLQVPLYFK